MPWYSFSDYIPYANPLLIIKTWRKQLSISRIFLVWLQGIMMTVIPFLPASNMLFTVGFVIAERILYLPSMGFCFLVAHGFSKLQTRL